MKKSIIILIFLLITIVTFFAVLLLNTQKVSNFSVSDYEYFVNNFPCDAVVGPVDTKDVAKEKADDLWKKFFGNEVTDEKPYIVYFDAQNDVWIVRGTFDINHIGGTPYILLRKSDGKVLAVWRDK